MLLIPEPRLPKCTQSGRELQTRQRPRRQRTWVPYWRARGDWLTHEAKRLELRENIERVAARQENEHRIRAGGMTSQER